jgi:hypothetical protein
MSDGERSESAIMKPSLLSAFSVSLVLLAGTLGVLQSQSNSPPQAAGQDKELAALRAEVEVLKAKACDQSHVMHDVASHFTNLWFAGNGGNWPLAKFFCDETRAHLRWAVRVIPVRKISSGDFDLRVMLDGIDKTAFTVLQDAVTAQDKVKFTGAYKAATVACTSCHIATEKPFLRVRVPDQPDVHVLEFTPP